MKKILLLVLLILMKVDSMERWGVYFDVVHSGVQGSIVAKVAHDNDNVKLLGHEFEEKDQLNLAEEEDSLEIVGSNVDNGTIGIYSSENPNASLLNFVVHKTSKYAPATISFVDVTPGLIAVMYRPSMGGGDNFVLALGHNEADISVQTVQQAQHLGHLQMYFPVTKMIGQ